MLQAKNGHWSGLDLDASFCAAAPASCLVLLDGATRAAEASRRAAVTCPRRESQVEAAVRRRRMSVRFDACDEQRKREKRCPHANGNTAAGA